MNTTVSPENLDTVCEGCLSQERHLTAEVTEVEVKKLYYEILKISVENVDNLTLRLCLECKANILKYDAFKRQVIEAHDILNKYMEREAIYHEHYHNPLFDFDLFLILPPDIDL